MDKVNAEHIPTVDGLTRLFSAHPGKNTLNFQGKCAFCNRDLTVEISATAGGFGFNGGMLLENGQEVHTLGCLECIRAASIIH